MTFLYTEQLAVWGKLPWWSKVKKIIHINKKKNFLVFSNKIEVYLGSHRNGLYATGLKFFIL